MSPRTVIAALGCLVVACGGPAPAPAATAPAAPAAPQPPPQAPSTPTPRVSAPAEGRSRPPTPRERAWIEDLSLEAARLRGLPLRRPVEVEIRDAVAMKQFVRDQLRDEPLDLIRQRYALLGLLDEHVDIWSLYLDVMEEQLMGYYDPERGSLAIREDVAVTLARAHDANNVTGEITLRGIVFHELIHALQDQHFDLSTLDSDELNNDEVMALQALVEGDATVATFAYYAEHTGTGLDALLELSAASMDEPQAAGGNQGSKLASAPTILRETLLFPYREGAIFVRALLPEQGLDWGPVNAAHRTPPRSTGAILWPRAARHRRAARTLRIPSPAHLDGPNVKVLEDEVLGPYETSLFLLEHGGQPEWAQHWAADRLWQLEIDHQPALAWVIALTDTAAARRVEALLSQRPEFLVTRSGNRIVVLRGVPKAVAESLLAGLDG